VVIIFNIPFIIYDFIYDILPVLKDGVPLRRMAYHSRWQAGQSSIHPHPEGWGFLERCYKLENLSIQNKMKNGKL